MTAETAANPSVIRTLPCDPAELRSLFLFEKLSDDRLAWLCEHGRIERHPAGWLYREGEPASCFYVLLDGTVALSRRVGDDDVEITRTDHRGVYGGAFSAYLGDRKPDTYNQSMRALTPVRMYVLPADDFAAAVTDWFPMAVHLLEGLFLGAQSAQSAINQRERLLALGSLSAGLTHELNNPAAASVRATSLLRERVAGMRHKLALIAGGTWNRDDLERLMRLQETAVEVAAKAEELSPLEASDREDELSDWFDAHDIGGGYELAPTFVAAGLTTEWLEDVSRMAPPDALEGTVRWLNYTLETESLMNEIQDSTERISTLVTAAKQYSQMDRAPFQVVNVHELLHSTLLMFGRRIGGDVKLVKEYDKSIPEIAAYAGELNQVWTNLIDNALQAMDGHGTLSIRTERVDDDVVVTIGDTGPGIPAETVSRIFEPFFTTKPVGQGTGLGLDISWRIVVNRHHGDLSVTSEPGDTRFRVRIPIQGPQDQAVG